MMESDALRQYMFTGWIPEAVETFQYAGNAAARTIQKNQSTDRL